MVLLDGPGSGPALGLGWRGGRLGPKPRLRLASFFFERTCRFDRIEEQEPSQLRLRVACGCHDLSRAQTSSSARALQTHEQEPSQLRLLLRVAAVCSRARAFRTGYIVLFLVPFAYGAKALNFQKR
jgi:hypothetical protein